MQCLYKPWFPEQFCHAVEYDKFSHTWWLHSGIMRALTCDIHGVLPQTASSFLICNNSPHLKCIPGFVPHPFQLCVYLYHWCSSEMVISKEAINWKLSLTVESYIYANKIGSTFKTFPKQIYQVRQWVLTTVMTDRLYCCLSKIICLVHGVQNSYPRLIEWAISLLNLTWNFVNYLRLFHFADYIWLHNTWQTSNLDIYLHYDFNIHVCINHTYI